MIADRNLYRYKEIKSTGNGVNEGKIIFFLIFNCYERGLAV